MAHGLVGAGIERGDRVALFAPNTQWVAACLAVIRVGAVAVLLDAHLGEVALEGILESSETKLIFTTSERADRLDTDASPVLLDAADDDERSWRRLLADADTELPEVEPEDVAALFYSSGTTCAAKGVPLSHRNIVYQLEPTSWTSTTASCFRCRCTTSTRSWSAC